MISQLVSRSSRTLPRRADRARLAARRRSVFMLERVEDRTLLSNWIGAGDGVSWTDADNWSDNKVPSATEPAIISGNYSVNFDGSAAAKSLTLTGGATLTGGTLDIRGGLTVDASAFNVGTVKFNGNGSRGVDITDASLKNVEINIPDNGLLTFVNDTNISGDLTFTKLSRLKADALNLGGNLTSNVASFSGSGTVVFVGDGNDQRINANGETGLVPGLAFNKTDGGSVEIGATSLNVLGGWKVHTGNEADINPTSADIRFVGQGSRTIDAGGLRFNNVHFGIADQGMLTVVGDLPIDGNLTIGQSFKGIIGGDITVGGDIHTESGTSSMGSGVFTLVGNQPQTISSGANGGSLLGLTFQKSGGSVTIASGSKLNVSRGLLVDQNPNILFSAAGSTIQLVGADTRTIDTGYASLGNVEININGQAAVTVDKMKVGGDLTIKAANKINAPLDAITVAGNLKSTDTTVGGTANITMLNGATSTITAAPGDFPDGGIVIKKGDASLNVNMTTPLDGPLTIESVHAINKGASANNGLLMVGNNVTTKTGMAGSATIVFAGGAKQTLTTTKPGAGVVGVRIDKTGGSLTLNTAASSDTLRVNGDWIVTDGNAGVIDIAASKIRLTRPSGEGIPITVNTGSGPQTMTFEDVEVALNSTDLNAQKMIVDGKLTLTSVYYISGVITANGDVDTKANAFASNGGRIEFVGGDDQRLTATSPNGGVPAVVVNKPSGTLFLDDSNKIRVSGNWTWTKGAVDATGSTVRLTNAKNVNTGDVGSQHKAGMTFNNFEINIGSNTLGVANKLGVQGNLTIDSAWAINAADGAITVVGDLISNDTSVGGTANITMTGNNPASIIAAPGDFPNGGIVITKAATRLFANVTQALDGPLTFSSGAALTFVGSLKTTGNVTTSQQLRGAVKTEDLPAGFDPDGKIIFVGNKAQILTATAVKAGLFGVEIAKSGGSLTINGYSGDPAKPFDVNGGWNVTEDNAGTVNATGATVKFGYSPIDLHNQKDFYVNTGTGATPMQFGNVVVHAASATTYRLNVAGKMAVAGDLTVSGIRNISGDITMVGDDDATASYTRHLYPGDSNGGLIINKAAGKKVSLISDVERLTKVDVNSGSLNIGDKNLVVGGPMSVASGARLIFKATGGTQLKVAGDLTFADGSNLDVDLTGISAEFALIQVTGTGKKLTNNDLIAESTGNPNYELLVPTGKTENGEIRVVLVSTGGGEDPDGGTGSN